MTNRNRCRFCGVDLASAEQNHLCPRLAGYRLAQPRIDALEAEVERLKGELRGHEDAWREFVNQPGSVLIAGVTIALQAQTIDGRLRPLVVAKIKQAKEWPTGTGEE